MKNMENKKDYSLSSEIKESWEQRGLRYILTQKCNYQCSFCHKEWCDGSEKELLSADDYDFIFSTAQDALKIQQVTLSGWEPMMRKNIWEISKKLHVSWARVAMVSNWSLISKHPEVMKNIDSISISLHTTDQNLYTALTWSSTKIDNLINEIDYVQQKYPHLEIKLNSVVIRWENMPGSEDFEQKIMLAKRYWRKLKYLELCNGHIPWIRDVELFEKKLLEVGFLFSHIEDRKHIYQKDGIEVLVIRSFCWEAKQTQNPQWYCKNLSDIFITPDGYLSACPLDIKKISAYDAIISRNVWELTRLFQQAVAQNTNYTCLFSSFVPSDVTKLQETSVTSV